jgi:large repetitive protein
MGRMTLPVAGPTNLTAASPTITPMLSWGAVSGATSYNIYRNNVVVGTSGITSYTDTGAPVGTNSYAVTAVINGVETDQSSSIAVQVETYPAITSANSLTANLRSPFDFKVVTTGSPPPTLSEAGSLPAGVTFTDNGDGTADLAGAVAAGSAASYPITITANNGTATPAVQQFVLTVTSTRTIPSFLSATSDTAPYGEAYSFTIDTSGYPAPSLKKTGALPNGLSFSDNGDGTATVAGTPSGAAAGIYPLTFTAKNTVGSVTQSFSLTVTKVAVFGKIPAKDLTVAVGANVQITIPYSAYDLPSLRVTAGSLPNGLSLAEGRTGATFIEGVPAVGSGGTYPVTVTATNSFGSSSMSFVIKVDEGPAFTNLASATVTIGSALSFQLSTTGYPAPKYSLVGTLPKGIRFAAGSGTLSGTPKSGSGGTYPLTFTATNSTGAVNQNFTLTVQ